MIVLDPRNIALVLGGDVTSRDSVNVPGPGHSQTDRSLSIRLNAAAPGGFVVFSHAGDDPLECRDYVRDRLGLEGWRRGGNSYRTPLSVTIAKPDQNKERSKAFALKLWSQSVNPLGSIVEHYLREHRALTLPADIAGSVIRFHGSLYFDAQTRLPGMVCLFRLIGTNEPCGILRTFLDRQTGQKIERRMLGVAKAAAIKLDPDCDAAGCLTIGEGVETTLAGRMAGLGHTWALGSSGAIRAFPALSRLSELTVLEENDPTSRRDVKACARRYLSAGKPVNLITSRVGNDMADAWKAANV